MALDYQYPRYLAAKRSVDDRALNQHVLQTLRDGLTTKRPRILEIGGGTGTMLARLTTWDVLREADYTLVDRDADSLAALPKTPPAGIALTAVHADISQFLRESSDSYDLVIAHAVLDLIDLEEFLPLLWSHCAPKARYWFTINFDGESVFLPPQDGDEAIWQAYHASMNRRPGSSHAGRKLFQQLATSGASIDASGSSDWVVHPLAGCYQADEAYFLHHIIHTVDCELGAAPPIAKADFDAWIASRHSQVDEANMVYIAHQLDFTGTSA